MKANDPRHGTYAGHNAGCRQECCTTAARNYQKRRLYEGRPRIVSSIGVERRIQALAVLGWTMYDIAATLGLSRETVRQWTLNGTVYRSTHERLLTVYNQLSMSLPPEDTASRRRMVARTRNRAVANGWAPPLAWDDDAIDDPNATPHVGTKKRNPHHEQTDERHASLADLDAWGYGISEACRRLNVSRDAIEAWAYRHDAAAVYQRLVERENYAEKVNGSTAERRAG